jgi:DNA-binding response OmpR family regulator
MKPTILLMDNVPEFLDSQSRLLERAHYRVLRANTLEEAEKVLQDEWFHIAIFDIRMEDEDDANDISGLRLAQEPQYRNVPKIILTAYPSYETAVNALGPIEGYPSAIDYVSKKKGHGFLQERVKLAFSQHVRINWDLTIRWGNYTPLPFPRTFSLFETKLDAPYIPGSVNEIVDLFRKLFHDYDQITISRLLWHKEGRVALEVFAYSQAKEEEFLVIYGQTKNVQEEQKMYESSAPEDYRATGTSIALTAETMRFAATAWILPNADLENTQPFTNFYQENCDKEISAVLEGLFQKTLTPWHQSGRVIEENKTLTQIHQKKMLPQKEFAEKLNSLAKDALSKQLVMDMSISPDQLAFKFNGGRVVSFPNPSQYLYDDERLLPRMVFGKIFGGLEIDTVLVNPDGKTWLSNFSHISQGPLWHDFVALETSIRLRLLKSTNFSTLYDFEKQFLEADSLSEKVSQDDVETEYLKALNAIQTIRQMASKVIKDDPLPYYFGLFYHTAKGLENYNPDIRLSRGKVAEFLHRLLLIAMIGEKISQTETLSESEDLSQKPRGIEIDEDNHEVKVNGKKADLTTTEFKLLLYLYLHAGKLCKRSEIMKDVFNFETSNNKSDESALNTQIGRLRKKIERDTSRPKYIKTVRNQGYKLIVQPE